MSNQSPEEKTGKDEPEQTASDDQAETENTSNGEDANNGENAINEEEQTEQADDEQQPALSLEEAVEKLSEAEAETARAKDDLLRVQAEMHNLRRRTDQDIEKAHKYALERFTSELLTVMDNLERAVAAAADSDDPKVKAIHEGVDLTQKSLADVFSKFNIKAIDPEGEPFDPQLHQAMSIQENPELEPDTVMAVMQKGYTLNERVIRPAMVVVSREASDSH